MFLILSAQMFPQTLLLITLYLMFASMSLLNSYWALVLSFTTFTLPLCIWMLKGYFDTLPDEMIEAAKVDGASSSPSFTASSCHWLAPHSFQPFCSRSFAAGMTSSSR